MERLTIPNYTYHSLDFMEDGVYEMANKLSKYEDTGLTPEQIIEMDKLYSELAAELMECKEQTGILNRWIYSNSSLDFEEIRTIEKIERALGYKLFVWQKIYIMRGHFRIFGKTTAECIRRLIDKNKGAIDYRRPPQTPREMIHRHEMLQIKEKLDATGLETCEIKGMEKWRNKR